MWQVGTQLQNQVGFEACLTSPVPSSLDSHLFTNATLLRVCLDIPILALHRTAFYVSHTYHL